MLLMFSLLWIPGVYAAGVPAQQGVITDEAGLLTSAEADAVVAIAAGDQVTVHVLTVESLGNLAAKDYAERVIKDWELATNDILLLISSGDQEIELNVSNKFQASLNTWSSAQGGSTGSAATTKFLDTYFIPYAQDGDFAGGITSVIQSIHSIAGSAAAGAGLPGSAGSGSTGAVAGSGGGSSPAASGNSGFSPLTYAAILGGILLLGAAFLLLSGLKLRKQLSGLQDQLASLMVRANQALELLKPFQGIVQGKTEEMVEGISGRLSSQLVQLAALQNEGRSSQPAVFRLRALKAALGQLTETEATFSSAIGEEEKKIAVVTEADRNVKQRIAELKQDGPELDGQFQNMMKETGFPLQEIAEDLKELTEDTSRADQLELFDPIAAQEILQEAQKQQDQIEQDLADVDLYDDKLDRFSAVLGEARSKISGIIAQNSLQNMKAKPYDRLEQANTAAAAMKAPLAAGDMDEVRRIGAQMDLLLDEALAMTEGQALLRKNNRRDVEAVRSGWSRLKEQRDGLQGRIAEARQRFAESHVASTDELLKEWSTRLREGAAQLPQIETWTSDERGEYDQARSGLDELMRLQEEAGRQFGQVADGLSLLDERLNTVNRIFNGGEGRTEAAWQLLHSRRLAASSHFDVSLLPEYSELELRLSQRPYNLDELESLGRAYDSRITAYEEEARRLVRQQEEAERQAELARLAEQRRRTQARKRMSSGPSSSNRSSGGSSWGGSSSRRSSGGSSWGGGGGKSGRSSGGSKW
ncbi:hypothetical protein B9T62_33875 [Paenibacillus donghaensis]|uniref:TPM domain-containing protein n=1 Tax=Paenibacillus donghaensis TaxID=414771 RepID=A0A2Z2KLS1_9BACL|nr:hypothetical protein B9T62_33875 [Paenibacillus donghaensis]